MEADDLLHGSLDQPLSLYKSHIRNPMKIHQPYEIFLPADIPSMGLLKAPPLSLLHSYRPFSLQQPPQPPLLPLPAPRPRRSSVSLDPSRSPANRNIDNRIRDYSFSAKKSTKPPTKIPKKEEKKSTKRYSKTVLVSSTSNSEQPKNTAKVSHVDSARNVCNDDDTVIDGSGSLKAVQDHEEMLPGSVVFTISPPPSSLPLPTFSLRPKLRCNAVAAGIDAGATDNLRQLLRLENNMTN